MRHGEDMWGDGGHQLVGPMNDMFGHGAWGWILPVLFLGILAAILVFLILSWRAQRAPAAVAAGPAPTAIDDGEDPARAAALRFARGEIDEDEFDDIRDRIDPGDEAEGADADEGSE